jgi:quercetin dioxygenase-like cupin family protein
MDAWIKNALAVAEFGDAKMNKVNLYESPKLFCDVYCLQPGQAQKPHDHADNDKVYYALSGTCHVQLGETVTPLPPGHVAVAPAGVVHGVENRSDAPATLLVVMAPHPRLGR